MEQILNHAKDHRLKQSAIASGSGDYGFDVQCIATQNAHCPADVATLGWCMSWYGFTNPRSVAQPEQHPAFGLAAWLAGTPTRPNTTSVDSWCLHLQDLLRLNLDASWKAWLQIADFMGARGVYFLHPALSNTDAMDASLPTGNETRPLNAMSMNSRLSRSKALSNQGGSSNGYRIKVPKV